VLLPRRSLLRPSAIRQLAANTVIAVSNVKFVRRCSIVGAPSIDGAFDDEMAYVPSGTPTIGAGSPLRCLAAFCEQE
jgi:hypothetical protein